MAKARMLSKSISIDKELNNLSLKSQLIFTWCVPFLDDFGLLTNNFGDIKYLIFPRNPYISETDINDFLVEAMNNKLIEMFDDCIFFKGFTKHNVLTDYKKSKSEFKENSYNKGKSKYSPEIPENPQEVPSKDKGSKDKVREYTTVANATPSIQLGKTIYSMEELQYITEDTPKNKTKYGSKTMAVLARKFAELADIEIPPDKPFDASSWSKPLAEIYRHFDKDIDKTIDYLTRASGYFIAQNLTFTPFTLAKNILMIDKWLKEQDIKKFNPELYE